MLYIAAVPYVGLGSADVARGHTHTFDIVRNAILHILAQSMYQIGTELVSKNWAILEFFFQVCSPGNMPNMQNCHVTPPMFQIKTKLV